MELIGEGYALLFSSEKLKEINRKAANDVLYKQIFDRFIPLEVQIEKVKNEAKSGSINDILKMACYYLRGIESISIPKGLYWLEQAAQQDHSWAQLTIAFFLADDLAPWGDQLQSCVWIFISAASNYDPAIEIRNELLKDVDDDNDEIIQIKAKMNAWYSQRKQVIATENSSS